MVEYNPTQTTPFTRKTKIIARLWKITWLLFCRPTPWFFYRYRVLFLRLFGAQISFNSKIASSAIIDFPWNLTMADYASIGDHSWIYCLDKIIIGEKACVGAYNKLITGTHNYSSAEFELITGPIKIGKGSWVTTEVTILHSVSIGDFSVIGVKSLVTKDVDAYAVGAGIPFKKIKERFKTTT